MSAFCLTAMAAEETTDSLEKILTGLTREEILAGGTVLGLTIGTAVTIGVIWFILQVVADLENLQESRPARMEVHYPNPELL